MKVVFTPRAQRQASAMDEWWREHRPDAGDLFAHELDEARKIIEATPSAGVSHTDRGGKTARRLLLPKTRNHVYFEVDEARNVVIVLAVWRSAPPRSAPVAETTRADRPVGRATLRAWGSRSRTPRPTCR